MTFKQFKSLEFSIRAISEGREAAREVDRFLMGSTELPSKNDSFLNLEV
jgi:glutamate synthase (NADPH/NADH) small chain